MRPDYLSVARNECFFDCLTLIVGAMAHYRDECLFIGAQTFHGFVQSLRIFQGFERHGRVNGRIRLCTKSGTQTYELKSTKLYGWFIVMEKVGKWQNPITQTEYSSTYHYENVVGLSSAVGVNLCNGLQVIFYTLSC